MKRKMLLTLLLACSTARASEWISLGESANGTQVTTVDVSSISIVGSVRLAWRKVVFAAHSRKSPTDANKWQSYQVVRDAINCAEGTSRFEAVSYYYEDGTHEYMSPEFLPGPWQPVPPDTMASIEMQFICTWKPK
jgi:hypothetical protein